MKRLLIVGAGGHGKVVKEIAEAVGCYEKIDFVDDNSSEAIGKVIDLQRLHEEYDSAFVGIGNNQLRNELIQKLRAIGYEVPILIDPSAYISKSCHIAYGTLVEPKAIVNTNAIVGAGCIISVGGIVDHDVVLEDSVHVNAGAIVKVGGKIKKEIKLEAGQVVLGHERSYMKMADANSEYAKEYKKLTGRELSFF